MGRNILHTIIRRLALWIGHILRRNCLLKNVIERKIEWRIEMTGRWGRRSKQLLEGLKEKREYLKLKEEAPARTLWRTRLVTGYEAVVRQTAEWTGVKFTYCDGATAGKSRGEWLAYVLTDTDTDDKQTIQR